MAINARGVIDTAKLNALCAADSASRIDAAALQSALTQTLSRLDSTAAVTGADATIAQLIGSRTLVANAPSLLGGNLPYSIVSDVTSATSVPESLRWRVRWSLFGSEAEAAGGAATARLDSDWHALARQRVTLSFVPATQDDADLIASYLPAAHADGSPVQAGEWPAGLPAYLIRVRAELRMEGQLIASGGEFILGSELPMTLAVYDPGTQRWTDTSTRVRAGETHVLVADAHDVGVDELAQAKTRWSGILASLPGGSSREAVAGEALRQIGLSFLATTDANNRLFQRGAHVVQWRLPSIARPFTPVAATVNYGIITQASFQGVALGVDRLFASVGAAKEGVNTLAYQRQDMLRSAAHGHLVLERLLANGASIAPAASAVKVLAAAGIAEDNQVLQLQASNAAALAPQVATDAATREAILQVAQAGTTVRVQRQPVVVGGWVGHAAAFDDGDGAGAYLMLDGSRSHLSTQLGAGGIGWVSVALPAQRPVAVQWLGLTVPAILDAAIDVLTPGSEGNRWTSLPARSEFANGALLSALVESVSSAPCEAVVPLVAAGLNASVGLGSDGTSLAAPPIFDSVPPTSAVAGRSYQYAPSVRDPQGLAVTLRLVSGPTGMVLGADRTLRWTGPAQGTHSVLVRADNGRAVADQRFDLVVGSAAQPLELGLSLTPTLVDPGQTVNVVAFSNAGSGNVTLSATLNGQPLALAANGTANVTAGPSGTYVVVIRATDAVETLERQAVFTVRNGADTTAPQAVITTPAADAELLNLVDVTGTASDANLAYYQLLVRPAGATATAWKEFARGTTNITNGLLGRLDPRTMANGAWEIGLRVVDVNARETTTTVAVEIARDLKLGQFKLGFSDIRTDVRGMPLLLTRTYDSAKRDVQGDFGWGWQAAAQDVRVQKNMVLGIQWNVVAQGLELCLRPAGQRRVTISLPDGGLYRFRARNLSECGFGQVPPVSIVFDALPLPVGGGSGRGAASGQLEVLSSQSVQAQGGMLMTDEGEPWNPTDFRFTSPDGMVYVLREGVGVLRVTDPYGNTVDYGPNGYQHSASAGIQFTRDGQGRITRATDPAGRSLVYAYNPAGELASVTDREGRITRFEYGRTHRLGDAGSIVQSHLLTTIIDPDGKVIASQSFDEYGRLAGSRDGGGAQSQITYDEANNRQTVTDRRGNATTYTFDAAGNITHITDARGGVTELTYDANGNELTRRNPLGQVVTKTFDGSTGLPLSESNPLNQTTSTTYVSGQFPHQRQNAASTTDARGNTTNYSYPPSQQAQPGAVPSTITEPLGRATQIGVDASGNLTSLNVAGIATSYAYDAQGRRSSETDGTGAVTTFTYDANGNELTRTVTRTVAGQPRTEISRRVYDAENRVIEETDAAGATRRITYNAAGKVATSTDALGRVTRYGYDSNARLTRTDHPDGTSETIEYDANGNETSTTDRQGRVTRREYDELDRLVRVVRPDGSAESTEYDAAGRVTASVDARGARTVNEYDAAGRQTASVDASTYAYDGNDRLTSETMSTATGSTVVTTYAWDANGNLQSKTSPAEYTGYTFDAENRLIEVRRGATAGNATSVARYGYDADGQRIRKQTVASTTHYLIDSTTKWPQIALEHNVSAQGVQKAAYVWGDQLRQQVRGGEGTLATTPSEEIVPISGILNTTIAAVDQTGQMIEFYENDAFGGVLNEQSARPKATHQYTGEYWDADAKLTYMRARWYDPMMGRFLSMDTFAGNPSETKSLNRYSYAHGDPVQHVDPSGMFSDLNATFLGVSQTVALSNATASAGAMVAQSALRKIAVRLLAAGLLLAPSQMALVERTCGMNPSDPACITELPTLFYGAQHAQHAALIRRAYAGVTPFRALTYSNKNELAGVRRTWASRVGDCRGLTGLATGLDCDEFPYFKHEEGGPEKYAEGRVALEPVPAGVNRSAGATWGNFLGACDVLPDAGERSKHAIVALPPGSTMRTFWTGRGCR